MREATHSPPETGQKVYFPQTVVRKFVPYKKDGQRQMKRKGRWQEMVWRGDFFKWENCETPTTDNWYLEGDEPAERPALIAENKALREALEGVMNGIASDLVTVETVADETWANVMSKARAALSLPKGGS